MQKKIIGFVILLGVLALGYMIWGMPATTTSDVSQTQSPTRPAEITGMVVSVTGNEVVVAKEIGKPQLTEAEQTAKKAEMQKLSEDQRQAAREAENTQYPTENITLLIPVGIPIAKGAGDGSGDIVLTDLSALTKGTYVSIWTSSENTAEYVKIKGL